MTFFPLHSKARAAGLACACVTLAMGTFSAHGATPPVVVTTVADKIDAGDGATSLREAILATSTPGVTSIAFDIPPAPAGAVLRLPAEESADDTAGNNDGTLQNGLLFDPGAVGAAFSFDGIDDQLTIPHNANQNFGSQMSIALWINEDTHSAGRTILQKRSAGNVGGYFLEQGTSRRLVFQMQSGGVAKSVVTPSNTMILDTWQHVVCTYDGAAMRIFVDGEQAAEAAQTGAIDAVADPVVLGRSVVDPSAAFNGLIDEVELFDRALTPGEIKALRDYGLAAGVPAPTGLADLYLAEGNAHDSQGAHGATPINGAAFGPGLLGQAFLLDGVDDYVRSSTVNWGFGADATFAAWVRTTDSVADLMSIAHGTVQDELLLSIVNGKARVQRNKAPGNLTFRESVSAVNGGQWTFVAGTMGPGAGPDGLKIYINGVEETGTANTVGAPTAIVDTTPRTLRIGWRNDQIPGAALQGSIDSVMVFDRPLMAGEVKALYEATREAVYAPRVIYVGELGGGELPPVEATGSKLTIDGYTQSGSSPNTNAVGAGLNTRILIELDGSLAGAGARGLRFAHVDDGGGMTVRGLAIHRFGAAMLDIVGSATNTRIEGNFLGVSARGIASADPISPGANGVLFNGVEDSTIGGLTPATRNLISHNNNGIVLDDSDDIFVRGNVIGLNAAGNAAIPNAANGIQLVAGTFDVVIGGTEAGAGNTISGNALDGIRKNGGFEATVWGNFIGTTATGVEAAGNGQNGINLVATACIIGGVGEGMGNTISFNGQNGVKVTTVNGVPILGNSIYANGLLGIDLLGDGVDPARGVAEGTPSSSNPKPPVLIDIVTTNTLKVSGTVRGRQFETVNHRIEIFNSPEADPSGFGEGRTLLGVINLVTNGTGTFPFTGYLNVLVDRGVITATDTHDITEGWTSEFSNALAVEGRNAAGAPWKRYR